jgi:hypothetical protein
MWFRPFLLFRPEAEVPSVTSAEIGNWIERTSLICGFVSFWLAAPELMGEQRLAKIENVLERCLKHFPKMIYTGAFLLVIGTAAYCIPHMPYMPLYKDGNTGWAAFREFGLFAFSIPLAMFILMLETPIERAARWAINHLQDDSRLRARCLIVGALLFILSFALQFAATFWK